jgi:CheY-like chemotaxis protein
MSEIESSHKTILAVDDDETARELLNVMLAREGFKVITASSGTEALEHLKLNSARKIDLVLLDMMMPGESGYETIKIMQQPDYQQAPVIVVTARELDPGTVSMIKFESNVKGYERKPVIPKNFIEQIHHLLGTMPNPKPKDIWDNAL